MEDNNNTEVKNISESKPKSPAEAFLEMQSSFKELYAGITISGNQLDQLFGISVEIKQKLLSSNDLIYKQGRQSALTVLFDTYNSLYRLVKSMKKGTESIQEIINCTNSDLNVIGIGVISPEIGTILNHHEMEVVETTNKSKLKIDQTIIEVHRCGFKEKDNVLLKAHVTIFKESK